MNANALDRVRFQPRISKENAEEIKSSASALWKRSYVEPDRVQRHQYDTTYRTYHDLGLKREETMHVMRQPLPSDPHRQHRPHSSETFMVTHLQQLPWSYDQLRAHQRNLLPMNMATGLYTLR